MLSKRLKIVLLPILLIVAGFASVGANADPLHRFALAYRIRFAGMTTEIIEIKRLVIR